MLIEMICDGKETLQLCVAIIVRFRVRKLQLRTVRTHILQEVIQYERNKY